MDTKVLTKIMDSESEALNKLLSLLNKQYALIMKKDVFALEKVVEDIQNVNKEVAELEVERRKCIEGQSLKDIIYNSQDEGLEKSFRKTKIILESLKLQKETNDLLIKQQLSYTNKMLVILNPNREAKTYNSYGNFAR